MNDIIELVEGNLRSILGSSEFRCPADDCDNQRFHVNIRRNDENGFVGDASCRNCDCYIELDLDDPITDAETSLDELQNQFST